MTRSLCSSLLLVLVAGLIALSSASWDGPVETVEREESIHHSLHNNDIDAISAQNDEIRQNRVDPVVIQTSSPPPEQSASAAVGIALPMFLFSSCLLILHIF